jgi:hypothetical protein
MSPRPARTVRSSLLKKGFVQIEDGDHHVFQLYVDGKKIGIRTYYSHGAKECDDYILAQMSRQLVLFRAQLNYLIDCQTSGEAYAEMLRKRGDL